MVVPKVVPAEIFQVAAAEPLALPLLVVLLPLGITGPLAFLVIIAVKVSKMARAAAVALQLVYMLERVERVPRMPLRV